MDFELALRAVVASASIVSICWLGVAFFKFLVRPRKVEAPEPLEIMLPVKWQDIEDVVKKLPEVVAHTKKLEARERKNRFERGGWQQEYAAAVKEIRIRNCGIHEFDHTGDAWYICKKCGWVDEWKYDPGWGEFSCCCNYHETSTFAGPKEYRVTFRSGNCKIHGRDWDKFREQKMAEYKREADKLTAEQMYAKGGILKKKEI